MNYKNYEQQGERFQRYLWSIAECAEDKEKKAKT